MQTRNDYLFEDEIRVACIPRCITGKTRTNIYKICFDVQQSKYLYCV